MKKILTLSLISASLLIAGTPIHDKMDSRIKGQSFSGILDDNLAAQDGLGVLPLQHHTGTTDMNNELLVQKVFNRIIHTETDTTKTANIKESFALGTVGTSSDFNLLSTAGIALSYVSGSLGSCDAIKLAFPNSTTGTYLLNNGKTETCDMTGSGVAVYTAGTLNSCKEVKTSYPTSTDGIYNIKNIGNLYCDMTTEGGGWTDVYKTFLNVSNSSSYRNLFFRTNNLSSNPVANSNGFYMTYHGTTYGHQIPLYLDPNLFTNFKEVRMSWVLQGSDEDYRCSHSNWVPLNGPGFNGGYTGYQAACLSGYSCIQGTTVNGMDGPASASYSNNSMSTNTLLTWSGSNGNEWSRNCSRSSLIPIDKVALWFSKLLLR